MLRVKVDRPGSSKFTELQEQSSRLLKKLRRDSDQAGVGFALCLVAELYLL